MRRVKVQSRKTLLPARAKAQPRKRARRPARRALNKPGHPAQTLPGNGAGLEETPVPALPGQLERHEQEGFRAFPRREPTARRAEVLAFRVAQADAGELAGTMARTLAQTTIRTRARRSV
jgi:hypothetical protein